MAAKRTVSLVIEYKNGKLVTRELEKTATAAEKIPKNVERGEKALNKAKVAAMALAAGMAAVGIAVIAAMKKFAAAGDELDKMSLRTGITVENLSRLGHAAQISGSEIKILQNALRMMARNMDMASRGLMTQKEAFDKLGISVKDSDGQLRGTVEVLLEVADKMAGLENATARVALASDIFGGRYGEQLLPMLRLGSEGIRKLMEDSDNLGITWNKLQTDQAAKLTDQLTRMQGVLNGIARDITSQFVPQFIKLVDVVKNNKTTIVTAINAISSAIVLLSKSFGLLSAAVGTTPLGKLVEYFGRKSAGPSGMGAPGQGRAPLGMAPPTPQGLSGWSVVPGSYTPTPRGGDGAALPTTFMGAADTDFTLRQPTTYRDRKMAYQAAERHAAVPAGLPANINEMATEPLDQVQDKMLQVAGMAGIMGGAFTNAFAMMASGASTAGDAIMGAMLGALGQIVTMWGLAILGIGAGMEFLPGMQLTGAGALAAGAALLALGGTIQGLAGGIGGGGGGGGGYSGGGTSVSTGYSTPMAGGGQTIIIVSSDGRTSNGGSDVGRALSTAGVPRDLARQVVQVSEESQRTGNI